MSNVVPISKITNRIHGVLHCRVFKLWDAVDTKTGNIWGKNFVVADNEGGAIQGIVPIDIYHRIEGDFKEGYVCEIGRFTAQHVKENGFTTVPHEFTLSLSRQTCIKQLSSKSVDMPLYFFAFKPLEDIGTDITNENEPIDIIGVVTDFSRIEEKMVKGRPTKMQVLYISNERGHTVELTLWANYIEKVDINGVYERVNNDPIILACSSVLIKEWRGNYSIRAYAGTRFFTDTSIKEISDYLERLELSGKVLKKDHIVSVGANTSPSAQQSNNSEPKGISLLDLSMLPLDTSTGGRYICEAEIVGINNLFDWYFEGCSKCQTKMKDNYCGVCKGRKEKAAIYRILLEVKDGDAQAEFCAMADTTQEIVGEPATTVIDESRLNSDGVPVMLHKLIGKTFKFTISGKLQGSYKNHRLYKVLQSEVVSKDKELLLAPIPEDSVVVEDDGANNNTNTRSSEMLASDGSKGSTISMKPIKHEFKTPEKMGLLPSTSQTPLTPASDNKGQKQKRKDLDGVAKTVYSKSPRRRLIMDKQNDSDDASP
ncbi:Replication factor-A carboxy-terminal domain protein [Rhynchospora pubera]|uniref:Replication factor-A carboxy-terminal domain protein n=1 Tax=Rhynchospora pubera TaxID=906938 RepID=A0AAV8CLE1_9POAL|nr:Replication factor-A carboxy-terminal domain protein [Rhynchospora pubera]